MTRINVGIPPAELTDKHLLAEHREIKRIPNMVKSGRAKIVDIPKSFTLGKGHVKFFYNKMAYTQQRYQEIHKECRKRGFNIQNYNSAWYGLPTELFNNYTPTEQDIKIIKERITERLKQ